MAHCVTYMGEEMIPHVLGGECVGFYWPPSAELIEDVYTTFHSTWMKSCAKLI